MKKTEQGSNLKKQKITITKSLERYISEKHFQKKVDDANEVLRTVGLPKEK